MTLVTPSGFSNFDWSPKANSLTKTASTGAQEKSDKDMLYEAAFKFVKAQEEKKEEPKEEKKDTKVEKKSDDDKGGDKPDFGKKEDKGEEKSEKPEGKDGDKSCDTPPCEDGKGEVEVEVEGDPAADVQKAIGALIEKSDKAEAVSQAVQEAVGKVEEALQGVKEVAGTSDKPAIPSDMAPGGAPEGDIPGVVGDAPVGGMPGGEVDEVEVELDSPDLSNVQEVQDGGDMGGMPPMGGGMDSMSPEGPIGGEELVGGGVEKAGMGMACASDDNSFVKLSSVSKETAKKVTTFWKDYLGYPEDYVKLMVKNYEK